MEQKVSIRFYNDKLVRAVWDEAGNKWWFSALDVVGAFNGENNYDKNRNYWKYLKAKLKRENSEVVSATTQLKLRAADGKRYNTDVMDMDTVQGLQQIHGYLFGGLYDFAGQIRQHTIWKDGTLFCRAEYLQENLKKCVDWSKIDKKEYLDAMRASTTDAQPIKMLLRGALTDDITSREMFMKGIDYSYYYEQM